MSHLAESSEPWQRSWTDCRDPAIGSGPPGVLTPTYPNADECRRQGGPKHGISANLPTVFRLAFGQFGFRQFGLTDLALLQLLQNQFRLEGYWLAMKVAPLP